MLFCLRTGNTIQKLNFVLLWLWSIYSFPRLCSSQALWGKVEPASLQALWYVCVPVFWVLEYGWGLLDMAAAKPQPLWSSLNPCLWVTTDRPGTGPEMLRHGCMGTHGWSAVHIPPYTQLP